MIKTIIFDFGGVFINLHNEATEKKLLQLGFKEITSEMFFHAKQYERGLITTTNFINFFKSALPKVAEIEIIEAWNCILKDFPLYRLEFLKTLAKENKYRLVLLSNTNELHIDWVKKHIPIYEDFKSCFDKFYLSHQIHLRKPTKEIFQFVLAENKLLAHECLFIDDTKKHIETASELGINTWHINPTTQDVVDLFNVKKELFLN